MSSFWASLFPKVEEPPPARPWSPELIVKSIASYYYQLHDFARFIFVFDVYILITFVIELGKFLFQARPQQKSMLNQPHPKVELFKYLTKKELQKFDGEGGGPIYLAVQRRVYDVSRFVSQRALHFIGMD